MDQKYVRVDRGALHKMIRLVTATTINGGFKCRKRVRSPEWIDFPCEITGHINMHVDSGISR